MGYATQRQLKDSGMKLNNNILVTDPIGYLEFIYLLKNSSYCLSDSGTVIEEACILGIPTVQMRYSTERPEVYDKAPSGRLYLDGSVSVDPDSQSIKDRKNLSANGYLEVTILITPKGNIHNNPILTFKGLPINEEDEFIYGLEEEIEKTSKSFKLGSKQQEHNLIDALKTACRKFTKEKTGKRPFTNINLVRV